jgi:xanthine/uracil permease
MEPLATGNSLDLSMPHVVGVVLIAVGIGLAGVGLRRFLMAYADELVELWREYGPIALRRMLDHRRAMPQTP